MAAHLKQALALCYYWMVGQVPDAFQLHWNTAVSYLLLAGAALGLSRRARCTKKKYFGSVGFKTHSGAKPQSHFILYVRAKSLKHIVRVVKWHQLIRKGSLERLTLARNASKHVSPAYSCQRGQGSVALICPFRRGHSSRSSTNTKTCVLSSRQQSENQVAESVCEMALNLDNRLSRRLLLQLYCHEIHTEKRRSRFLKATIMLVPQYSSWDVMISYVKDCFSESCLAAANLLLRLNLSFPQFHHFLTLFWIHMSCKEFSFTFFSISIVVFFSSAVKENKK